MVTTIQKHKMSLTRRNFALYIFVLGVSVWMEAEAQSRVTTAAYPWWWQQTSDPEVGRIRLVGGQSSYSGRVEVYYNGQWGTICDDSFDHNDAKAICRMLGWYHGDSYGRVYGNAYYGSGSGPILLDELHCSGYETSIGQCSHNPWFSNDCTHSEDVGVDCNGYEYSTVYATWMHTSKPYFYTTLSAYTNGNIRLVNGGSYYGRVEVYNDGIWGTICDVGFDHADVQVICRMVGSYYGPNNGVPYYGARFGQGNGAIGLQNLGCYGYESNIFSCNSNGWLHNSCGHYQDAGVNCAEYYSDFTMTTMRYFTISGPYHQYGNIRLVNGYNDNSGRVEIYHDGRWGTICDDEFDHNDVQVICRMIGHYYGSDYGVAYSNARFGPGYGDIALDDLGCNGYESDLAQCRSGGWFHHNCQHNEDAGVDCGSYNYDGSMPISGTTMSIGYSLESAITVGCNENGWNIIVDMYRLRQIHPGSKASDIYLGENSCTGNERWNEVVFQQGVRECLTSETVRQNVLVYSNQLIYAERDPNHQFIIRHYNWTVGVECDVMRNETSSGHIQHDNNKTPPSSVVGTSHYSVNMSYYLDPNFMYPVNGNALQVPVGTQVYIKVFTTTADWTIKLRVHTCYAKPTEFAADNMKYFLLKNGCEVDRNTHIISQSAHETRIVFQDFEYTTNRQGLHLFCDAVFCGNNDYSQQCQQTCNPIIRRSALAVHSKVDVTENTFTDTTDTR